MVKGNGGKEVTSLSSLQGGYERIPQLECLRNPLMMASIKENYCAVSIAPRRKRRTRVVRLSPLYSK